jgi:hypothetical protein
MLTALLVGLLPRVAAARSLGEPAGTTVIVIPALYRAVQIAFDVERFHSAILVSYQQVPGTGDVVFHGWDGSNWQEVEEDLYRSGGFTALPIVHAVIVGDEATPDVVFSATDWAPVAHHIKSYALSDQVNGYAKALELSPQQIRWFAKQYDMRIEDLNWERRRYGRYGPPHGRKQPVPPSSSVRELDLDPSLGRVEARELSAGDVDSGIPEKGAAPAPVRHVSPPAPDPVPPHPVIDKGTTIVPPSDDDVTIENSPLLVPEEK